MSNIGETSRAGIRPRTRQSTAARGWRLSQPWRKAVLSFHVASSVALIGTTASVIAIALSASASGDAAEAEALYKGDLVLAFALAIPFSFAALLSGLLLGFGTPWGIVRYYWVVAKIVLMVAIILTGALLVGPSLDSLASDAGDGLTGGELGSRRWVLAAAGIANVVFAAAATALAVFKPWGRIRPVKRDGEPNGGSLVASKGDAS